MTVSRSATRAAFLLLLIYPACSGDPTGSARACNLDCSIVFAERINFIWDLYTINADGSNRQPLMDDTATDVYPAWSPDHRQIAFWSGRDPQGVYLMNGGGISVVCKGGGCRAVGV